MATETEIEAMARIVDRPRDIAADAIAALDRVRADAARDTEPDTAKMKRLVEAAEALRHLLTYGINPRTYSAQWLAAVNELGEALAGFSVDAGKQEAGGTT